MRGLILITFFIFCYTSSSAQTDLDSLLSCKKFNNIEYYESTKIIHYLQNTNSQGKKHGKCYSFDRNGELNGVAQFRKGKKHGNWVVYNIDGNLIASFHYYKGDRIGHWKSFNESGELITERVYK